MRTYHCYIVLLSLFGLVLAGCNTSNTQAALSNEEKARAFVQTLGTTILTEEGEISRYTMNEEMLRDLSYMQLCAVQDDNPEAYLDREIVTYGFIIDHHPLEQRYAAIYEENEYETYVMIMIVDGKVIGGGSVAKSMKIPDLVIAGGYSAVDGRTMEEVSGMEYAEWFADWKAKYGHPQ